MFVINNIIMATVYVKYIHSKNGVTHTKQKVCTVLSEDQYGNLTVRLYNDEHKDHEIRVLQEGQFSHSPYLIDFE